MRSRRPTSATSSTTVTVRAVSYRRVGDELHRLDRARRAGRRVEASRLAARRVGRPVAPAVDPAGLRDRGDRRRHQRRAVTTHETLPPPQRTDRGLRVARDGGVVRVTWRGDMTAREMGTFGRIVTDLVDGQGNLNIAIELMDMTTVDIDLLDVLVDAEQRLSARGATLSVSTRVGVWRPEAS